MRPLNRSPLELASEIMLSEPTSPVSYPFSDLADCYENRAEEIELVDS